MQYKILCVAKFYTTGEIDKIIRLNSVQYKILDIPKIYMIEIIKRKKSILKVCSIKFCV